MGPYLSFALVMIAAPSLLALGIYADLKLRRSARARRELARVSVAGSSGTRSAPRAREQSHPEVAQQP
jgi:hypothetical protein